MAADLIGMLCIKLTGRESGRKCVIIDVVNDNFVLIDGNVKRRKCNINHLEFLNKKVSINKNAATEQVQDAMKKLGIEIMKKTKKEATEEKPKAASEEKKQKKDKKSKK